MDLVLTYRFFFSFFSLIEWHAHEQNTISYREVESRFEGLFFLKGRFGYLLIDYENAQYLKRWPNLAFK